MDRAEECVCCTEVDPIMDKFSGTGTNHGPPECITAHPSFEGVCLNEWVLETASYHYQQQYSDGYDGPQHKRNRHFAYRQLAMWCWGKLGRHIRVVLPSCAVSCVRAHFPPPKKIMSLLGFYQVVIIKPNMKYIYAGELYYTHFSVTGELRNCYILIVHKSTDVLVHHFRLFWLWFPGNVFGRRSSNSV